MPRYRRFSMIARPFWLVALVTPSLMFLRTLRCTKMEPFPVWLIIESDEINDSVMTR